MDNTVNIGSINPSSIHAAGNASRAMNSHFGAADKLDAMGRHPATTANRRKEFTAQAQAHREAGFQAGNAILTANNKTGSFSRRGSFHSAVNAQYN